MKKFLQIFYLIILFALFCIYEVYENSGTKVIEVLTPVKFAIDMNNNDIADEGETICIPEIDALTSDLHIMQEDLRFNQSAENFKYRRNKCRVCR